MIHAISRLILIAAISLILIVFALFFVRWLGFQQTFASAPHPWFESANWHVYKPTCSAEVVASDPSWILLISVRFRDGEWWRDCAENSNKLGEILTQSTHANWILEILANDSAHLDPLVGLVGAQDKAKKFAVVSDSQRVSRYLRKKAPQWLFAADPASLLRMQMFASLWIETAIDFWPDFVIATANKTKPSHLSTRMAQELDRRHKRILWSEEGATAKPEFPIHGIVTTRPTR